MLLTVPDEALGFGLMNEPVGTHGSRRIMLKELRLLLSACPMSTDYEGFRAAIVEENVLLKNTVTTRKGSFRRLREMYALENTVLFRALGDLWDDGPEAQSLLALLSATARDSILRAHRAGRQGRRPPDPHRGGGAQGPGARSYHGGVGKRQQFTQV